ncbi:6-phosphogluconolactonase, cycloisomerase 2 family [Actinacidiphila alni]|uniref:6-phosphogluconolactonase, cycloisomerase 2 family n=1 Tax=Actinacidiphila alni TaxID=380248 RepID=A0A1I2J335_9ACTN|nr:beta-propeller fold lactonase family protein [Actinacidiphila alni]SFF49075.1 6-phosphogluconolactonase, cycloisomerase 2 family [Actinacidiphila alni]
MPVSRDRRPTHPTRPTRGRMHALRAFGAIGALGALGVATALVTAPAATAASHAPAAPAETAHIHSAAPVFVQSDNPAANTVVAYHRAADGTLSRAGVYGTGGKGGVLDGSVVDHLASQGSLVLDARHGLLYAVNAGSDTVTVFAVRGDRLERVQVISSGGDFPVGVAVHGNAVYVLNALDGGSIQGFLRIGDRLVRVPSWHRGLGLDPSAAPQFTHTPGQISFTPDGTKLVVTTKAGGNSIEVFPVGPFGGPASRPVVTATPDAVPFGFTFDPAGRLQVTEAGPNAVATFALARDGRLTQVGRPVATGQAATCWIVGAGDRLYASNAGSGSLSGYTVDRHGALRALGATATDGGTVDAAVSSDGRYLYAQTGAAGVVDEFRVGRDGSLTPIGSVTVPGALGGEGIAAG